MSRVNETQARRPIQASAGKLTLSGRSNSSQTLASQVSRRLVLSILRGGFEAGSLLPSEKELGRQFNVSRPIIREAVKEAEVLGLIQRWQGRLTRVAPSEEWRHLAPELLAARTEMGAVEDLLLELLELRRMVELESAALAARRATDKDLTAMRKYLVLMDAEIQGGRLFAEHDIAFHDAMLAATGNTLLQPLFRQLRPLIEFGRKFSAHVHQGGRTESQRGHREIYEAVAAQDADRARVAMSDHLSWTATLQLAEREARLTRTRRPRARPQAKGDTARDIHSRAHP